MQRIRGGGGPMTETALEFVKRRDREARQAGYAHWQTRTQNWLVALLIQWQARNTSSPVEQERLVEVLTAWESAVSVVERDGDDSAEAVADLSRTRSKLLEVLSQARDLITENERLKKRALTAEDTASRLRWPDNTGQ